MKYPIKIISTTKANQRLLAKQKATKKRITYYAQVNQNVEDLSKDKLPI
jgi:hypothetical protein